MNKAKEISAALQAPFPEKNISYRIGATNKDKTKGLALPYINSRAIQKRLDNVVGLENLKTGLATLFCTIYTRTNNFSNIS